MLTNPADDPVKSTAAMRSMVRVHAQGARLSYRRHLQWCRHASACRLLASTPRTRALCRARSPVRRRQAQPRHLQRALVRVVAPDEARRVHKHAARHAARLAQRSVTQAAPRRRPDALAVLKAGGGAGGRREAGGPVCGCVARRQWAVVDPRLGRRQWLPPPPLPPPRPRCGACGPRGRAPH